jgi:predicted nucleotidyltransferase component of viral defense system
MVTFDYLLPKTKEVLIELSLAKDMQDYTFVGGSALSCYLQHRLSEDLDFFTWNDTADIENLLPILNNDFLTIINRSSQQTDLLYKGVKITFFSNKWDRLKLSRLHFAGFIQIASLELLAIMKVNTLFLRAKYRDYYDLYCIVNQKYTIYELFTISSSVLPGLSRRLFQVALTFTDDISDDNIKHLSPAHSISKKEIESYFLKKIKEWNKF